MDNTILVTSNIEAGQKIVEKLDEGDFKPTAAFWFYVSDLKEWQLMLASNFVDQKGPLASYKYVQEKLMEIFPDISVSIINIVLLSPQNELIKLFQTVIRTENKVGGIRFARNIINGVFIEDAYIYRML